MRLAEALAKLRALTPPVTEVTGEESATGYLSRTGESQAPQGFVGFGNPVTEVTDKNIARPKIPPCGPAEAHQRGLHSISLVTSVTTVTTQQPYGFERKPAVETPPVTSVTVHPWTDLDVWCARLGVAGDLHARRVVLREWVAAAGGWSDAAAVYLPTLLPAGLALARLKAHARGHGLAVRDDVDSPEVMQWLQGSAGEDGTPVQEPRDGASNDRQRATSSEAGG